MPKTKAGELELFYEVTGEGEPVLFIHGLGSSSQDWEAQVPAFEDRYRVITLDLRGHGQSAKPLGPYSIPQFAEDIINLMNAFRVGSAHVIGISLGGAVAFELATHFPNRLKSLTVVNSAPELDLPFFQQITRMMAVRFMSMEGIAKAAAQRFFPKSEQAALRKKVIERWSRNDKVAYTAAMNALRGWSVKSDLGKITVPTLIIAAEHDYTPVANKKAYAAKIQNATVEVFAGSHHATPVEQPEKFNALLRAFIDKHTDRPL